MILYAVYENVMLRATGLICVFYFCEFNFWSIPENRLIPKYPYYTTSQCSVPIFRHDGRVTFGGHEDPLKRL